MGGVVRCHIIIYAIHDLHRNEVYESPKTCWVQRCLEFCFSFILFCLGKSLRYPGSATPFSEIGGVWGMYIVVLLMIISTTNLSISALEQLDFEIQQEFSGFKGVYGVFAGDF